MNFDGDEELIRVGPDPHLTKVTHLWAWIVKTKAGEGIVSMGHDIESQKPLVFADPEIAKRFTQIAEQVEKQEGVTVELRCFMGMNV